MAVIFINFHMAAKMKENAANIRQDCLYGIH